MKLFGILKKINLQLLLILFFANIANAHIIHKEMNNRVLTANQFKFVDLTGDGLNDIVISVGFNQETFLAITTPTVGTIGARDVEVLTQGQLIKRLPDAYFIDANSGDFISGSTTACLSCIKNSGEWVGGAADVYIGFRFTNIATNTLHYAWLRLGINSILSEFTLKEIAYEMQANTGLYTGFIPITDLQIQAPNGVTTISDDDGQLQLEALITPFAATQRNLDWSVDNTALASINNQGLITAIANGNVLVTARTLDGSNLYDTLRIYMSDQIVPVSEIQVYGQNNIAQINTLNGTLQCYATVLPAYATNQQIIWSVDDKNIATIDNNGVLTAKNNGTVKVIATAIDGSRISGFMTVNISGQPIAITNVNISGCTEITIPYGTLQLQTTILPFQNIPPNIHWSIDNNAIASISSNGLLTGFANGIVTVKAMVLDGSNMSGTCQVRISNQWVKLESLTINGQGGINSITVDKGSLQMIGNFVPSNASNKNLKWSVDDENIATISPTGKLSAIKNGIVNVYALAQDGSEILAQKSIEISNQYEFVESITLATTTRTNIINTPGASVQITANILPITASNQQLFWLVDDNSKAYINQSGLLTASSNGNVQVTAISQDGSGVYGRLNITISNQNAIVQSLNLTTPNNVTQINTPYGQLQLTPVFTPSVVNNNQLIWTVDNQNNAIVDQNGLLTALRNGSVTVKATTQDGSGVSASRSIVLINQPVLISNMIIQSSRDIINLPQDTLNLSLNILPANHTNSDVIWLSSNPNIATVNKDGVLSAVSNGTVTITAISQDGSGIVANKIFTISNQFVKATALTIVGRNAITISQDTLQCSVSFTPSNVTNSTVYWSVNDEAIATILPNGLLKAKGNGTVIVSAKTKDGSNLTVTKNITISNQEILINTMQIAARTNTINIAGDTLQLSLSVQPNNISTNNFVWRSSDESIASVSYNGLVTAYKDGIVTITASALDASTISATYVITVSNQHKYITGLSSPQNNALVSTAGGMIQLNVNHTPNTQTAPPIHWSVDNPNLAFVTPNGKLHALANGTVNVTALAMDGSNQSLTFPVRLTNQKTLITNLSLSASSNQINTSKGSLQINANILPANASLLQLVWKVDNPSIAQVSQLGLLTAYANGTVTVTAKTLDGSNLIATYTVNISNQSGITTAISLNTNLGSNAINTPNGTLQMIASITPSSTAVRWSVSDTTIASIDQNGLVIAKRNGNVTVTIMALDGSNVQSSYTIVISNQRVNVTAITLSSETGNYQLNTNGGTLRMFATISPANAYDASVTWSVRAGSGWATISNTGVITPIHNGTIFVRATSNYNPDVYAEQIVSISYQSTSAPSITSLTLTAPSTNINVDNGSLQLNANISPSNAKRDLVWEVSNTNIATINPLGKLTALANGIVTVTAYSLENPNVRATEIITISNQYMPVSSFLIRGYGASQSINTLNGTLQMEAYNILPTNAILPFIKWTIDNPSLAIITEDGLLRAFGNGTVTVTAYAQDGSAATASTTIQITSQYIESTSINVAAPTVNMSTIWQNNTIMPSFIPANASFPYVKYTSADTSIVYVSAQGILQAKKNGTTQVTVQAQDYSGAVKNVIVNVTNQVTLSNGINITAPATNINIDKGTLQLEAIHSNTPSNTAILWRVSDESIAKVSNKGLVTALKNGNVIVYAYAQDRSNKIGSYQITITNQKQAITSININGDNQINSAWQPTLYTTTIIPNSNIYNTIAWSVNDTSLATINKHGLLIPKKNGTIIISAKAKDASEIIATKTVQITGQKTLVQTLQIANNPINITGANASQNILSTLLPNTVSNSGLYYIVRDPSIANVNAYGLITAINNGQTMIDIYTADESNVQTTLTVNVAGQYPLVTSVNIQSTSGNFAINTPNAALQLTATALAQQAPWLAFAWSSSNNNIATVTTTGLVIAKQNGSVNIQAKALDGSNVFATVTLTISNQLIRAQSIALSTINNVQSINTPNGTLQINANIMPLDASSRIAGWSSSNTAVARVNNFGLVTALGNGTTLITARTLDGSDWTNTFTVSVTNQSVNNTVFEIQAPNNLSSISTPRGTLALQANFSNQPSAYNNVAWSSSDNTIATVNHQGLVTAIKNGTVVITATTLDGNFTTRNRTITITNQPELVSRIQLQAPNGSLNLSTAFEVQNIPNQVTNASAQNRTLKWYSDDAALVSIDSNGQVRAWRDGIVKIYALSTDGSNIKDSLTFQISNQYIYAQSLQLSAQTGINEIDINGGTLQINLTQTPTLISNQHIHWSVDNEQLASIDQNGLLKAKRNGLVRVSAWAQDGSGIYGHLLVDISNQNNTNTNVLVEEINIQAANNITSINTPRGNVQFSATVLPMQAANQQVVWSVSNKQYGMIDAQGLFTAWGDGEVLIFATSQDGSNVSGIYSLSLSNQPNIVNVEAIPNALENVKVYPNPFMDYIDISMFLEKGVRLNLYIVDIQGRVLKQANYDFNEGEEIQRLYLNDLANGGVYILYLQEASGAIKTFKLIKY